MPRRPPSHLLAFPASPRACSHPPPGDLGPQTFRMASVGCTLGTNNACMYIYILMYMYIYIHIYAGLCIYFCIHRTLKNKHTHTNSSHGRDTDAHKSDDQKVTLVVRNITTVQQQS